MNGASFTRRLALAAVCMAVCAHAQVTVETEPPSVITDSIDIFSQNQDRQKSANLAIAATLVLPGSGHRYLGHDRSLVYLTAEAMWIFSFFFCDHYAKKNAQGAAGYAWIHSGANGPINDADDYYWKVVGNFMDIQDYNNAMDLNRTPDEKFTDENLAWHWDDKSSQDRFNDIRSSSRSFRIISSFFLGALVLDRIVAFIDIRTATRDRGIRRRGLALYEFKPILRAAPGTVDLSLTGSF